MRLVTKKAEVLDYLRDAGYGSEQFPSIAVEALIFTPDGKLLLEKRGPLCKDAVGLLEGVGGGIDHHEDLHEALRHEINTEIGAGHGGIKVSIDRLLEIRPIQFEEPRTKKLKDWVVVSYLCKLLEGRPDIAEPEKIEELVYLTLDELYDKPAHELSGSTVAAREVYKAKYGSRPYFEVPESPDGL